MPKDSAQITRLFMLTLFLAALQGFGLQIISIRSDVEMQVWAIPIFLVPSVFLCAGSILAFYNRVTAAKTLLTIGGILGAPLGLLIVYLAMQLKPVVPGEGEQIDTAFHKWVSANFAVAVFHTFFGGVGLALFMDAENGSPGAALLLPPAMLLCVGTWFALRRQYRNAGIYAVLGGGVVVALYLIVALLVAFAEDQSYRVPLVLVLVAVALSGAMSVWAGFNLRKLSHADHATSSIPLTPRGPLEGARATGIFKNYWTHWVVVMLAAIIVPVVVGVVLLMTGNNDDTSGDYWDGGPNFVGRTVFNVDGQVTEKAHQVFKACGLADDQVDYLHPQVGVAKPGDIYVRPGVKMVALEDSLSPLTAQYYAEGSSGADGSVYLRVYKRDLDGGDAEYLGTIHSQQVGRGVFEIECTQNPRTEDTAAANTETPEPTPFGTRTAGDIFRIDSVEGVGNVSTEVVIIRNLGNEVDLQGWALSNDRGDVFRFPKFRMQRGALVRIFSRQGQNTPAALYWGRETQAWVDGDTVTLADLTGDVQATYVIGEVQPLFSE